MKFSRTQTLWFCSAKKRNPLNTSWFRRRKVICRHIQEIKDYRFAEDILDAYPVWTEFARFSEYNWNSIKLNFKGGSNETL